jgi:hypothetical protein
MKQKIKTYKELDKKYQNLSQDVSITLSSLITPDDTTIIYEIDPQIVEDCGHDYYIRAYDKHGAEVEMGIERVQKNGEIYGYIGDLDEYWTVYHSDVFNIECRLTLIQILENENC